MAKPPQLPRSVLTNRAERGLRVFRLLGWLTLAALVSFLSLTAAQIWAPRTAARLAEFGLLPKPPRKPAPAEVVRPPEEPLPTTPVREVRDPRLGDAPGRPLVALSGKFDPNSPMEVLIPGESVNAGVKVRQDARRRSAVSGRGAPPVDGGAGSEAAPAPAAEREDPESRLRRILLKRRFNVALGIVAVVSFVMFVSSGFLASLLRPHPSTLKVTRKE